MAVWKRIKAGCVQNPGCWDNGDGSITTVTESADVPGVTRHHRSYYAVGRGPDSTWYEDNKGNRLTTEQARARLAHGCKTIEPEENCVVGRAVAGLSNQLKATDLATRTLFVDDTEGWSVAREKTVRVFLRQVQYGTDFASPVYGLGFAQDGDPPRALTGMRTVVRDADGDVVGVWVGDAGHASIADMRRACDAAAERDAFWAKVAADHKAARDARFAALKPLFDRAYAACRTKGQRSILLYLREKASGDHFATPGDTERAVAQMERMVSSGVAPTPEDTL